MSSNCRCFGTHCRQLELRRRGITQKGTNNRLYGMYTDDTHHCSCTEFSAIVMMLDYPGKQPLALTLHFPQCMTLLAVCSKSHLSMIQYSTQRHDVIQGP